MSVGSMKVLAPLSAVLLLLLPGCAQQGGDDDGNVVTDPTCAMVGADCMANMTAPHLDARQVLDDLRQFSEAFPYRQSGMANHLAARDDLAARFESSGLEVVRQSFPSGGDSTVGALPFDFDGENILGIKWGTDRESWIVIGAHYDITEGAIYGTYDDGSGTVMVFELAEAFANVPTDRTIVFAEFDQEEMGLVGSRAFIEAVTAGTFPYNASLDGMIDLDMIGITYPHPAHIIVWENSEALTAKILEIAEVVGIPSTHFDFRSSGVGSSDGAAFIQSGIATAYLFSDWDEYYLPGGVEFPGDPVAYVGTYPWWHKADTYETMVISAGDEATLLAGFQNTVDLVSPLLLHMASAAFEPDPEDA